MPAKYFGYLVSDIKSPDKRASQPLIGVSVEAINPSTGAVLASTTTNSAGYWSFTDLTVTPDIYYYPSFGDRVILKAEKTLINAAAGVWAVFGASGEITCQGKDASGIYWVAYNAWYDGTNWVRGQLANVKPWRFGWAGDGDDATGLYVQKATSIPAAAGDTVTWTDAPIQGTILSSLAGVDFLVGTATGVLSAEIAVGTAPGGELGGTWASPTVDATHSGSAHHVKYTDAEAVAAVEAASPLTLTGDVGIGNVVTPLRRLDLWRLGTYGTLSDQVGLVLRNADDSDTVGESTIGIELAISSDGTSDTNKKAIIRAVRENAWANGVGLAFLTANGAAPVEVMRLTKAGDLALAIGNITLASGKTVDGRNISDDLNQGVKTTNSPTFVGLTLTGDLQVNGGDIGIAADTDLLGLASDLFTVRGEALIDRANSVGNFFTHFSYTGVTGYYGGFRIASGALELVIGPAVSKLMVTGGVVEITRASPSFAVLSGAAGSDAGITLGRTAQESIWGIAATAGHFSSSAQIGDAVIRVSNSARRIWLQAGDAGAPVAITNTALEVGTVSELVAGAGVTIDGVLLKDGLVAQAYLGVHDHTVHTDRTREIPYHVFGTTSNTGQPALPDEVATNYIMLGFVTPSAWVAGTDITIATLWRTSATGLVDLEHSVTYAVIGASDGAITTLVAAWTDTPTQPSPAAANVVNTVTITIAAANIAAGRTYSIVFRRNTGDANTAEIRLYGVRVTATLDM